ncbi:uncharacterized mitochondrial protein AtMg00810-like [Lathyrus oleraceus]|uniref:uncharacterized mitochondrial protein AtMg00810-like n=1 Tax=Pisum sativum TaxID=3888 RepID=UPI0021CE68DE|nr:uncharacterized mitochondrial protein AtMg00810-like [Pisum sativum]
MEDSIFLCQIKYAKGIVNKFGLENASHKRVLAPIHLKLSKDEKGLSVDQSIYKSMIGSLLCLTASRPDITFVVGVCARYQVEPKVSHINQVKTILKYVNGTSEYGILYSHDSNSMLVGYCGADWDGSVDDRKKNSATDKELRKFVASVLKEVNSDVLPDVQKSLAKDPSPANDSSEKV